MLFRSIMILLGIIIFPTVGYSQIPTVDIPGTLQAGNEVGQTLNSVKSSTESMNFLQKTSSAVGTFTKNVSEFASDQKEKIQKKLEKLEKYKEQAEEYKAQLMAYKEQAEEAVNTAKDAADQAKGYYNQAQDAVDQAQGALDQAKSTVENVKAQAQSAVDGVKDKVEEGINKAESVVGKDNAEAETEEIGIEEAKIVEQETPTSTRKGFVSEEATETIVDSAEASNNYLTENTSTNNTEKVVVDTAISNNNEDSNVSTNVEKSEDTKDENNDEVMQPTRSSFETSFGYGHIHNSSTLAFAGGVGIKTGETPEGVMIVPKAISVRCDLSYEQAAKDTKYAECLQNINDKVYSQDEKVSAEERTDTLKDLANSYLEMLASQYFEGLKIYNESFYFKNNEVDPILNSEVTDVRGAWQYAKDMNQKVGSRINIFNQINSRALELKGLGLYYHMGIKTPEDQKKQGANS